ncbi:MAG: class II fructose-1,6-bisphosphate aldolase [Clostridia bacterium]|nr:class II fructose-1,6-bisphosphate aldolase [Clostridia bacterium]
MYTASKELLEKAKKEGYAVPAFNAENLEMVQAIISAAEYAHSPVMIQTTPPTVKYIGAETMYAMVSTIARMASVPVALHLDHCSVYEDVISAIEAGYSSVMFDGSKLSFDENVSIAKRVVEYAKKRGVTVEAELGTVGGKEDNVTAEGSMYTDPAEAEQFARDSGVDMLAVAIGTAHGFYKGEPKLDFDRIEKISSMTKIPLVLHGGSGVPEDSVKRAISLGMSKVNFATELRCAATKGVRRVLLDESVIDPKKYMGEARKEVYNLCLEKIAMCGSENKA